jgi:hypothetical protein
MAQVLKTYCAVSLFSHYTKVVECFGYKIRNRGLQPLNEPRKNNIRTDLKKNSVIIRVGLGQDPVEDSS